MDKEPVRPCQPVHPKAVIVILAGGRSSRMGTDKARIRLGRHSLLGHVRATAQAVGVPVRVQRRDAVPRCGPLGGVWTALKSTRADLVVFLACDMPLVTAAWLRALLKRLKPRTNALFTVLDQWAGFPFVVRTRCRPTVERQLRLKRYSLQSLMQALQAGPLHPGVRDRQHFLNINTPEDLAQATEVLSSRQRARPPARLTSQTRAPFAGRGGRAASPPPAIRPRRRPGR